MKLLKVEAVSSNRPIRVILKGQFSFHWTRRQLANQSPVIPQHCVTPVPGTQSRSQCVATLAGRFLLFRLITDVVECRFPRLSLLTN